MADKPTYEEWKKREVSRSYDPLAIGVFSVALVILIVLSFFLIRGVKTYLNKPGPAVAKKIVNTESEQIEEISKKRVEPKWKRPPASQSQQQAPHSTSVSIKAKLPKTTTNQELLKFVQREAHIRILHMPRCLMITDISPLSKLTHLQELYIPGCKNIQSIAPLSSLKNLRKLVMSNCTSITDISPLLDFSSLTEVYMPPKVTNEQLALVIPKLPELRALGLPKCKFITDISPLSSLNNLYRLSIVDTKHLSDITSLSGLSELRHLALIRTAVSDLSPISELPYLTSLTLWGSRNLTDLSPLASIKSLKSLGLNGSHGIIDLTPLSELTYLTKLSLANMRGFNDISPLYGLTHLKRLDLVNSKQISTRQINELERKLPKCVVVDPYNYSRGRTS